MVPSSSSKAFAKALSRKYDGMAFIEIVTTILVNNVNSLTNQRLLLVPAL
jgi:hypothetical protein